MKISLDAINGKKVTPEMREFVVGQVRIWLKSGMAEHVSEPTRNLTHVKLDPLCSMTIPLASGRMATLR